MKSQESILIVLTTLTLSLSHPLPQRPLVFSRPPLVYRRPPMVYLSPRPVLPPGAALSPAAAAASPLGAVLRHTNAVPNSPLDISEFVDVGELVPGPLGPAAAALLLTPAFSAIANGLTDTIYDTAVQNDPYLFQRGRVQFQNSVSPRFKLFLQPLPVSDS